MERKLGLKELGLRKGRVKKVGVKERIGLRKLGLRKVRGRGRVRSQDIENRKDSLSYSDEKSRGQGP